MSTEPGSSRNASIFRAHRDGVAEAQLADEYGVSRQRIHQIRLDPASRRAADRQPERDAFAVREVVARVELERLLGRRRKLNAKIRRRLDELRTAREELEAMDVDRILGLTP